MYPTHRPERRARRSDRRQQSPPQTDELLVRNLERIAHALHVLPWLLGAILVVELVLLVIELAR